MNVQPRPGATIFRHARWRVLILGVAGVGTGSLVLSQSWDMLDPSWHTDASRGAWLNVLPPVVRTLFMIGVGALLVTIGVVNAWVVLLRSPALILDPKGITALRVLQRRLTVPWRDITRIEEGKGRLVLHRESAKPLVIGYDWFDATPQELRPAVERQWLAAQAGGA